ncbi:MAG: hypothetical protein IT384_31575 [Deltaproteobacteria bacterium]|nr:hypothetical protein [Deltaproteobacteria bacterium]
MRPLGVALASLLFVGVAPQALATPAATPIEPSRAAYSEARRQLEAARAQLSRRYRTASPADRERIVREATGEVIRAVTDALLPAWVGTPWSFSGISDQPGEGTIACGMFVGTILAHAGFNLDRIALGRLASEHIARSLVGRANVRRYSDRSVPFMEDELHRWGPGLYLVGLDLHAGLIFVDTDRRIAFIHSSVYPPATVVWEPLDGPNPFADSRYRVLAQLFDPPMIERWLIGERFEARAD